MAGPVQRQAGRDLSLFSVPKPIRKQEEIEGLRQELQLQAVQRINEMLDIARRHMPELPRIDEGGFSVSLPNERTMVVQSGGALFTVSRGEGQVSVYWSGKKVTLG
ncbi:MAG TPA: hypothetical protein PKJ97_00865 [Candidatus Bilamarchaeaceae archaeon]|nr:hypothetical protein [Candidatus Bilamarchaeaceae archaeon]